MKPTEDDLKTARGLVDRANSEWLDGTEDHHTVLARLIAAALAGEREKCAQWHDKQALEQTPMIRAWAERKNYPAAGRAQDTANFHDHCAAAIRALNGAKP